MILRHGHTNTGVHVGTYAGRRACVCVHARRLAGAHTHAHTIQKSHITHEILMAQSNRKEERKRAKRKKQKWRGGRQRERREGETERGESKKERQMKAICLYYQSDMRTFSKLICILNHHFLPGA